MKNKFMEQALKEANKARLKDEVPVGCVIVKGDKIIARGHNTKENTINAVNHAEIVTLQKAYKKLKSWRLEDCEMYVTLEPCMMCSGAIVHSRIKKLYFGAKDPKAGTVVSIASLLDMKELNYKVEYEYGILEEDCSRILKDYFKAKRAKKNTEK